MSTSRPLALVTGASSGIGAVFARHLSRAGYAPILVARRRDRLEALARELPEAEVVAADLTHDADVCAVEERCANIDMLVNNAGFGTMGRFSQADPGSQDAMHRLHVLATMRLTRAALPGMMARGRGAVINVSSVAGFMQSIGNVSYCATKAWINSFTEGVWLELNSIGSPVRIQALCPGFTISEFHDVSGFDRKLIPGWLWLNADDVVAASLRGLERNRLFVIPGWKYRGVVAVMRNLPRGIQRALAIRTARRMKRG